MVKKGTKAIRSALAPVKAKARQDEDQLFEARDSLAPDPDDPRLTPSGAKVGADGKLDVSAYEDLQSAFEGEPPPAKHPIPDRPGVRAGEDVPKGLRIWDDLRAGAKGGKDGAGWIAQSAKKGDKKKEKWFNIRTIGSWRLAFLLARLQRELWERGSTQAATASAPAKASAPARASAPAAAAAAVDAAEEGGAEGKPDTPPKVGKRQATPTAKATARKAARRGAEASAASARQEQAAKAAAPNPFAGSERFAAIMAAKKAQEVAAGDKAADAAAASNGKPSEWV